MSLFNPSRDEVRDFFFDTWSKYQQQSTLTDLEKIALGVVHLHPEYQSILSHPQQFKQQSYFPEMGEANPFLHMSLHLSILEQLSINQPPGITPLYQALLAKHQDEHTALHQILECLAETIWQAQRNNTGLDTSYYLQLLQQRLDQI